MPPRKPIPIRKTRKKRDFHAEALHRLKQRYEAENEDQFDPTGEPVITPILKSAEGGIARILEALRAHDDDDARSFMELYDSLSATDRKYLKIEEIAAAAGIGALRLAEISTSAIILHGQLQAKLNLASAMGKVVKSVVKAATDEVPITAWDSVAGVNRVVGKTNGDVKAMELFGKMTKLVPVPKGAQIYFGMPSDRDDDDGQPEKPIYLDPGQRLKAIKDAVEPRRLPAPASPPIDIGGRLDHLQTVTAEIITGHEDV